MLLHVDDIGGLFPRDGVEQKRVKEILEETYDKLKETEEHYIGMHIVWNEKDKQFEVDMERYIDKMCEQYDITIGVTNPNVPNDRVRTVEEQQPVDMTEYRTLIGQLRYVGGFIGGMALYPISILSTRQSAPVIGDYNDAIRVLKYLYMTKQKKMIWNSYNKNKLLRIWCDASFANHPDGKSQECIVVKFGDCKGASFVGSWKQKQLATSIGNAEVCCATTGVRYGGYIRDALSELGEELTCDIVYYEDNKSCVDLVVGDAVSNMMKEKYMKVRINALREYFADEENHAKMVKVGTKDNLADIGTKELFGRDFKRAEKELRGEYNNA
jgi:hypothetical protein